MRVTCAYDGCHTFEATKPNSKYCPECRCYNKAQAARKRIPPKRIQCAYPGCDCVFETTNAAQRYCKCPEHDCTRKARIGADRKRQDSSDLFEQPLEFKTLSLKRLPDGFSILIVGDTHIPFQDGPTLACVEKFWDNFKPDLEIYNGDCTDFYSISPFDQNPSRLFSLQDELDMVRGWLAKRAIRNASAKRIYIEGNHEDRLRRWLWRHGPDLQSLRALDVGELLGLNELGFAHLTYMSAVDVLGFVVEHGYKASKTRSVYRMNVAKLMAQEKGTSGLCNHTHGLGTYYWTDLRGTHSYRENGSLCRQDLEYAPNPPWQWGFTYGVVHKNKLHLTTVPIYEDGMRCEGEFYPRVT